MATIIVWLLISIQDGTSGNYGVVTMVERFPTAGDCEYVRQNMPSNAIRTRCIQAKIVVVK